jgi:hypothetical protein
MVVVVVAAVTVALADQLRAMLVTVAPADQSRAMLVTVAPVAMEPTARSLDQAVPPIGPG